MHNEFFIGVDGGGTSCRARLENQDGLLLAEGYAGSANINADPENTLKSITAAIHQAVHKAQLNKSEQQRIHVGLGIAGAEMSYLQHHFSEWKHPFASMVVQNDAHVACLGAHGGKDGGVLIIGTGIKAWLIAEGNSSQWTGYGFPLEDKASGAWLGQQGLTAALQAYDGLIETSEISTRIMQHFDHNTENIIQWAKSANAASYAYFARWVTQAYAHNDLIAMHIVSEQISWVENIVQKVMNASNHQKNIALMGGLADFVRSCLPKHISQELVQPQQDAQAGALYLIRQAYHNG